MQKKVVHEGLELKMVLDDSDMATGRTTPNPNGTTPNPGAAGTLAPLAVPT